MNEEYLWIVFIPMILLTFGIFVMPIVAWTIHNFMNDRKEILRLKLRILEERKQKNERSSNLC